MIFVWLNAIVRFFIGLIVPPERQFIPPAIDPNAPCPGCGNTNGSIRAVQDQVGGMSIQHQCAVCKLKWSEKTVLRGPIAPTSATTLMVATPAKE